MTQPSEQLDPGSSIVRTSDTLWRRTDTQVIVLPRHATDPICLSGTGVALWEAIDDRPTVGQLSRDLASRFGVAPEVVAGDIEAVLRSLRDAGAIQVRVP